MENEQIDKALKYALSTSKIENMNPKKKELTIIKNMLNEKRKINFASIIVHNIKTKKKELE